MSLVNSTASAGLISLRFIIGILFSYGANFEKDRYLGIKSRGCYDSPAMTIVSWSPGPNSAKTALNQMPTFQQLRAAHLDLEGLVMDGKVRSLRDQFVTHSWSEFLYNG